MDLDLKGKVVAITGGSQGIGKAAALEFCQEGCQVCICARRADVLEATKAEFAQLGYTIHTGIVDVTNYEQMEAFADEVMALYGRIDIWVNNAGGNRHGMLIDLDMDTFQSITAMNYTSVFAGCKIAALRMRETGGGVILNASSYAAITPLVGRGPYGACKAGVLSLTRTFASELAPYHIRVVAYVPGTIVTELSSANINALGDSLLRDVPSHRFGQPEDLGRAIAFLASDRTAGYINGVALEISGGKRSTQNPWLPYELLEVEPD